MAGVDPFSLELLRTVSGRTLSLRVLALLCDENAGLVYGTIDEVPADLEGLDTDRILALDAASERTLIGLLGEASYVRVDARDVLAEHVRLGSGAVILSRTFQQAGSGQDFEHSVAGLREAETRLARRTVEEAAGDAQRIAAVIVDIARSMPPRA